MKIILLIEPNPCSFVKSKILNLLKKRKIQIQNYLFINMFTEYKNNEYFKTIDWVDLISLNEILIEYNVTFATLTNLLLNLLHSYSQEWFNFMKESVNSYDTILITFDFSLNLLTSFINDTFKMEITNSHYISYIPIYIVHSTIFTDSFKLIIIILQILTIRKFINKEIDIVIYDKEEPIYFVKKSIHKQINFLRLIYNFTKCLKNYCYEKKILQKILYLVKQNINSCNVYLGLKKINYILKI